MAQIPEEPVKHWSGEDVDFVEDILDIIHQEVHHGIGLIDEFVSEEASNCGPCLLDAQQVRGAFTAIGQITVGLTEFLQRRKEAGQHK